MTAQRKPARTDRAARDPDEARPAAGAPEPLAPTAPTGLEPVGDAPPAGAGPTPPPPARDASEAGAVSEPSPAAFATPTPPRPAPAARAAPAAVPDEDAFPCPVFDDQRGRPCGAPTEAGTLTCAKHRVRPTRTQVSRNDAARRRFGG